MWQQWAFSALLRKIKHVEDQQDDRYSLELFDRRGKLNVEMN